MLRFSHLSRLSTGLLKRTEWSFAKERKFKIVGSPSETSKLIFDEQGVCKIYEYKRGENYLRRIVRYIAILTFVNGMLYGYEMLNPIFGRMNLFSFGLVTGLGYFLLILLQVFSRRIVHRIHISKDFQTIHVEFFNAFWKPKTLKINITEFQEPTPGFADFTRFELTRMGKIWINLPSNEFRNVVDYQDTLGHLLLGQPLTNLNVINIKKKHQGEN